MSVLYSTGLNNYADQIQALVGNGTNREYIQCSNGLSCLFVLSYCIDSREWKCGISIEDVLQMPEFKASIQQPLKV